MDRLDAKVNVSSKVTSLFKKSGLHFWLFPVGLLILFFFIPMGSIVGVMFTQPGKIDPGGLLKPLFFTIWQAVLSTLLTLMVGLPAAYIFSRFTFAGKRFMKTLTMLPFILPTVVVAAAFNALLGPRGWVNLFLMNLTGLETPPITFLNTITAILVAHVFYNAAIVIRVVGSAWSQLDPRLEQSARVLGASPWRVFSEVTFPLLKRPIAASALLVFLFDFASFGVILLLGGAGFATLEVSIYIQALSMLNLPMAGLLSMIQLACTLVILLVFGRVSGGTDFPLFPRLQGEGTRRPGSVVEKASIILVVGFLFVLQVFPLVGLAARSVTRLEADRGQRGEVSQGFTLDYYRELFVNKQQSIFYVPPASAAVNSIVYAGITTLISVTSALLLSYALVKVPGSKRWLDPLVMLPFGASAVTLGLGFIITFSALPISSGGFPLLVPIAHSLVAMPFVLRTIQPVLASIPDSLRQSAAVLGASPWRVWRDVEFRIIGRALLVGVIFSFAISLGEFGATSFIASPKTPTLPVAIYRYLSQPGAMNYGQAMAMSTILILVCTVCLWLLERIQIPGITHE